MTEQKFCKDCKWLVQSDYSSYATAYDCLNPIYGEGVDRVTGISHRHKMNAQLARSIESACGASGKWWEPKPPTYWQKLKTYFQ